jgi:hypothetical protein
MLLIKWECDNLLTLEDIQDPELPRSELYTKIGIIKNQISFLEQDSIKHDICKMNETQHFALYKLNKTHCLREEYINDNNSIGVKQLIMQLKLGVSHLTFRGKKVKLKSLEKFYGNMQDDSCELCGREPEDVYHIMFKCHHYKSERETFVHSLNLDLIVPDRGNYIQLFNNLNEADAMSLYNFFNCALKRRMYYLSCMID